jgi:GxxExxY protein
MDINQLSSQIIGAAIEVHKTLGPGLLESAYEKCLCHELKLRGLLFESRKQKPSLRLLRLGGEIFLPWSR